MPESPSRPRGRSRRSVLTSLGLLGLGGAAAWWARDNLFWPGPSVEFAEDGTSGWLAFATEHRLFVSTRAMIGDTAVDALIDSGAQRSVVDATLAEELDLPRRLSPPQVAYGLGGGPQLGHAVSTDVRLGWMTLNGLTAGVLDLGPLASSGLDTRLILGWDVLSRMALDIDFPGRRLRFGRNERAVAPAGAEALPAVREGRGLMTQISVEGAVLSALLDTGASPALSLNMETAEAAGLLDGRETREASSIVLGGVLAGQVVTARTLTLGERLYENVEVHAYPRSALPGIPPVLAGMGLFRDDRLILDIGQGRMLVA
ncbi:MAG: aspartyl protease family protein [Brevundimonas sp.]|uniref:aspartyl protease family protein n=1 Tax=Brevundimonas sp. TaxID=1871086 RepID=UPI00391A44A2